ncbi:MAG TPA: glycerol-3-phosphate dehydrogenase/oxidase [Burkholderiaceae bacterium]|nr:glycerol-3-phosphate dehydrogenase/oxidase [Burkholderiaceae bacterium]
MTNSVRAPVIERGALLAALREDRPWDVVVIGGGATGLGIAVDAAQRGLRTALIEAHDFSGGTSSRSTKLIHGGVRYLAQGNVKLVREALAERALLLANAPELVHALEFIVPCYRPLEREVMRVGLGLYDALAGARGIGPTRWLTRAETIERLPTVRPDGLHGGVSYWDAQFDDARLAVALMRTACRLGATVINYVRCDGLGVADDHISVVGATDAETGERFELRAKVVYNAAGVWVDRIRSLAGTGARPLVALSRGSHIVVPSRFLPGQRALMIPKTSDGRVLFAIPWLGHLIVGTTDVPTDAAVQEPQPTPQEIDFIVETARGYLRDPIAPADISNTFAGLRPLVAKGAPGATKTLSREHTIVIEHGNLVTVTGGKWTTYRRMAVDALDQAIRRGLLPASASATATLRLDVDPVLESAQAAAAAAPGNHEALLRYRDLARMHEQARTAADVVERRMRIGLLDRSLDARLVQLLS